MPGELLLVVRQMAGTTVPRRGLPQMLRKQTCAPARYSLTFRAITGHLTGK
jgi:hypothetical protein